MIANAVDVDDPRIVRRPANAVRDDSDLGERLVTCAVPPLPDALVARALANGRRAAAHEIAAGRIVAALLCLQGRAEACGTNALPAGGLPMNDLFSLAGRTALVTGGSRGIGRMIAAGFLAQGARVYISSRKAEACDATAAELSPLGPCVSLPADVSTIDGVEGAGRRLRAPRDTLDILVNNAGAAWGETFDTFPEKGWDKVVDLNLKTPFFLTQALIGRCAPPPATERPAKVINIASIDGISVNPQETYSYAASKAGLIQLTRRMALRLVAGAASSSARSRRAPSPPT